MAIPRGLLPKLGTWGRSKPGLGAQVNWGHPLTRGQGASGVTPTSTKLLTGAFLLNSAAGNKVYNLNRAPGLLPAATLQGATWTSGYFGGPALNFVSGSSQYVDLGATLQFNHRTIIAWVFPTSFATGDRAIVVQGNTTARNFYVFIQTTGVPYAGFTVGASQFKNAISSVAMILNAWTQMATTYDGITLKLYLNGAMVGSSAQTGTPDTSVLSASLGRLGSVASNFYDGKIDHVLFWNEALTANEIAYLYCEPFCFMQPIKSPVVYSIPASVSLAIGSYTTSSYAIGSSVLP